jgi:outer membrane receptor for ferrienterochelin and colicins
MNLYPKSVLIVLFNAIAFFKANAQHEISGKVLCDGEPAMLAQVYLAPIGKGAVTSANGVFTINGVESGSYQIKISALGFKSITQKIEVENSSIELGEISMEKDLLGLEEVVITGNLKETYVLESPVKVDVITSNFLERTTMPTNLVESISLINGVQEVVACGVCYTNSISINGLPGPYTAILLDGAPIYGNLASVYGLNGIPRQMIERMEVIKGPNSTLYGSEAMAGVINIITKDPGYEPRLSVDLMGTSHGESFGNISVAKKGKFADGFIGINYAYINDFDDDNNDGFGDNINLDRVSVFSKWNFKRKSGKEFTLGAKYYFEDRRNGVEEYIKNRAYKQLRGSDSIYGESIYTNRFELFGKYEFAETLNLQYSFSHHDQNSYYGSDLYEASQQTGFLNLIKNAEIKNHQITSGITLRGQLYDDNTVATQIGEGDDFENKPEQQFIPGLFIQDEFNLNEKLSYLAGYRLDHYGEHGLIGSPRLSFKYLANKNLTLRTNFGTGFRIVNLFTEDHAFVTGQRQVVIAEEILPERSLNASFNGSYQFVAGKSQGKIEVDAFYTRFTNKIIPDYEQQGLIIYSNTDGFAQSHGLGISWTQGFKSGLSWTLGANWQNAFEVEDDEMGNEIVQPIFYTSSWSGNAIVNYTLKASKIDFAYTARFYGPIHLPVVFDLNENGVPIETARPTVSKPFALHNIQATKRFSGKPLKIYAGIQNLFNYQQFYSPLIGFNDPNAQPGFSDYFDTAYAYSPLHGREVYIGFIWFMN